MLYRFCEDELTKNILWRRGSCAGTTTTMTGKVNHAIVMIFFCCWKFYLLLWLRRRGSCSGTTTMTGKVKRARVATVMIGGGYRACCRAAGVSFDTESTTSIRVALRRCRMFNIRAIHHDNLCYMVHGVYMKMLI